MLGNNYDLRSRDGEGNDDGRAILERSDWPPRPQLMVIEDAVKWFAELTFTLNVTGTPFEVVADVLSSAAVKLETRRVSGTVEVRFWAVPVMVKG